MPGGPYRYRRGPGLSVAGVVSPYSCKCRPSPLPPRLGDSAWGMTIDHDQASKVHQRKLLFWSQIIHSTNLDVSCPNILELFSSSPPLYSGSPWRCRTHRDGARTSCSSSETRSQSPPAQLSLLPTLFMRNYSRASIPACGGSRHMACSKFCCFWTTAQHDTWHGQYQLPSDLAGLAWGLCPGTRC